MYYTHLYGEIRKSTILLYMVFDTIKKSGRQPSWKAIHTYPSNTKHLCNICTASAQRLRRWSKIVQMQMICVCWVGGWGISYYYFCKSGLSGQYPTEKIILVFELVISVTLFFICVFQRLQWFRRILWGRQGPAVRIWRDVTSCVTEASSSTSWAVQRVTVDSPPQVYILNPTPTPTPKKRGALRGCWLNVGPLL